MLATLLIVTILLLSTVYIAGALGQQPPSAEEATDPSAGESP